MDKFEYEVFKVELKKSFLKGDKIEGADLKEKLNEFGIKGWELVTKIDSHYDGWTNSIFLLFKRKI